MRRRNLLLAATFISGALALTSCSVADPDTSQFVLHYSGGSLSSQNFEYCITPGTRSTGDPGDYDFYYPAGQRTYTFADRPGADASSVTVATRNQIELTGGGSITFHVNQDCSPWTDAAGREWPGGRPQKLHDTIGRQYRAYAEAGGELSPPGWKAMLDTYLRGIADRAMDTAGQRHAWQALYSDPAAKAQWTEEVKASLPKLINEQMGGDLLVIDNVQLDQPGLPPNLASELINNQAAMLRKKTAEIDQQAAAAFPGGIQGYLDYQQKQAVNKAISEGRANPLLIPQGSPVIVGGR